MTVREERRRTFRFICPRGAAGTTLLSANDQAHRRVCLHAWRLTWAFNPSGMSSCRAIGWDEASQKQMILGRRSFTAEAARSVAKPSRRNRSGFWDGVDVRCRQVQQLLARKIEDLEGKLMQLQEFKQTLDAYRRECEDAQRQMTDECPVVEHLGRSRR